MKTYEELNGYVRIRKENARRLYNYGISIYIVPCNVAFSFDNAWFKPFEMNKEESKERFERVLNSFTFYNCQGAELGYYPHYWVKKEEVEKYDARRYK